MSLFSTLLPVIMRQQSFSLSVIACLQLMKLPWILKFLWAPLVDSTTSSLRSYKRWIIYSEMIYAFFILVISLLDITIHFKLIFILIILSFVASATQDIATDALATLSFDYSKKSVINSIQSMGSFLGTLLGGGLLLMVYKIVGWSTLFLTISLLVIVLIIPLCRYKNANFTSHSVKKRVSLLDLFRFFKEKTIKRQVFYIMSVNLPLIGLLAMLKPWLVDWGYSTLEIGMMFSVWGAAMGCFGSFLGGLCIRKMGRFKSALLFTSFVLLTTLSFFLIAELNFNSHIVFYALLGLLWLSYGSSSVLVYTLAMDFVREGKEGTDFTLQIVLTHLGAMILAIMSGRISQSFGYSALSFLSICLALFSLSFTFVYFKNKKNYESANSKI